MTIGEWNAQFRKRQSNPIVQTFWRKRQRILSRLLFLLLFGIVVFDILAKTPWIMAPSARSTLEPIVYLFLAPVIPILTCIILWPRLRTSSDLEQILLTRLPRGEVAFGIVWKPLLHCLSVQIPLLMHLLLMMVLGREWDRLFESNVAMYFTLPVLLLIIALAASLTTVRVWCARPNDILENVVSIFGHWFLVSSSILIVFFLSLVTSDRTRFYPRPNLPPGPTQYGYLIQSFALATFCAVAVLILLRLLRNRRIGVILPVAAIASLILVGSPGFRLYTLLHSAGLYEFLLFVFPLTVLLAGESARFRAALGERVFQEADPETLRDADWYACEAAGRDERGRVRSALAQLGATLRVGLDPKLLVGTLLLGCGLLVSSSFFAGMLYSSVPDYGTGVTYSEGFIIGVCSIAVYYLLATLLPLIAVLDISRVYPDRRIPVLKGGILSGLSVYACAPTMIALLHPLYFLIIYPAISRSINPGHFIVFAIMALVGVALGLGVVASMLSPKGRRMRVIFWMVAALTAYYFQVSNIETFQIDDPFFPNYAPGAFAALLGQNILVFWMLSFGIGIYAQRLFRGELASVARFEFNQDPREVVRLPRMGCLALKHTVDVKP